MPQIFFPVPRHTHSSDRPSDTNQWMAIWPHHCRLCALRQSDDPGWLHEQDGAVSWCQPQCHWMAWDQRCLALCWRAHSASWCWGEASHLDPAWQVLYSEMGTVPSCCQCSWGTLCSSPALECECDHPLSWYVGLNHDAGVSGFWGFPLGRYPR